MIWCVSVGLRRMILCMWIMLSLERWRHLHWRRCDAHSAGTTPFVGFQSSTPSLARSLPRGVHNLTSHSAGCVPAVSERGLQGIYRCTYTYYMNVLPYGTSTTTLSSTRCHRRRVDNPRIRSLDCMLSKRNPNTVYGGCPLSGPDIFQLLAHPT